MTEQLRLIRHLPAAPERVWRAVTDPAALAAWFWPPAWGTTAQVDLRVGGGYALTAARGLAVTGEYQVVEAPQRLVFTWQWAGEAELTLVTIELVAADGGTDLVLTHERFAGATDRDNNLQGWNDCLDRLPGYLTAPEPAGRG
jgi:uncharacterized protein YndB with AHSA1/START domain